MKIDYIYKVELSIDDGGMVLGMLFPGDAVVQFEKLSVVDFNGGIKIKNKNLRAIIEREKIINNECEIGIRRNDIDRIVLKTYCLTDCEEKAIERLKEKVIALIKEKELSLKRMSDGLEKYQPKRKYFEEKGN
ncbi:MAG: hypothetical protein GY679_02140 [Mycoplasma sp.]|nr:hypothetical protein [Mycoplasma sp.]